jgi:hypothetical protein
MAQSENWGGWNVREEHCVSMHLMVKLFLGPRKLNSLFLGTAYVNTALKDQETLSVHLICWFMTNNFRLISVKIKYMTYQTKKLSLMACAWCISAR